MRAVAGYLVVGLTLIVVGLGLWAAGRFEHRIVDTERQLLTLHPSAPVEEYEALERSIRTVRGLPWFAGLARELRLQRATANYWSRDYASFGAESKDDPANALDPELALVAVNAAYRRIRLDGADRTVSARLDEVLGRYSDILRQHPRLFDAAFNFEFVARTRDRLSREGARSSRLKPDPARPGSDQNRLHPAPTVHGLPGMPVENNDPSDLKIMVPRRTDERQQQPEAGLGNAKPRKG